MKTVIEIQGVTKKFKSLTAVNNLTCSIQEGEFIGLLGPNGAGKTTLIEMIEGLRKPDAGEIKIFGKEWAKDSHLLHTLIGLSLQETKFVDKLTTEETLTLFASFYSLPNTRVNEVLDLVNLDFKRKAYVDSLSGGQRQRLALGIALLNQPRLILLDEPTTGLDPTARREIWNILEDLKKVGTTMILTTHYLEEAEFLCDRILIMNQGEILAEGSLTQLIQGYGEGDVVEFELSDYIQEDVSIVPGFKNIYWDDKGRKGRIILSSLASDLQGFLNFISSLQVEVKDLDCRKTTLDDLFISMTGRSLHE
ncbi:ABC transporter ATP-binding protein [Cytophagaceae bacterium ABcell3]|nr:ABC transporter ATP-binding protein [Cytophagaceae bacterium ABcell3]